MLDKIKDALKDSDRTYGALRVWYDLLAEGRSYGLHRVKHLMRDKTRSADIEQLNSERHVKEGPPDQEQHWHPPRQYDNKRLTQCGEEICSQLFDKGKSPITVAHLMVFRRRRRVSDMDRVRRAAGGAGHLSVDLSTLPQRKFYRRYENDSARTP